MTDNVRRLVRNFNFKGRVTAFNIYGQYGVVELENPIGHVKEGFFRADDTANVENVMPGMRRRDRVSGSIKITDDKVGLIQELRGGWGPK